jgi:CBS domain containing-hemolysin-like protein
VSKADPSSPKRERNRTIKWVVTIFLVTIVVSGMISLISDEVMARSGIVVAFIILLMIILVGVVFDILGMAVATADEKPFHSMAARKVPGAQEAIALLRNAERVSSICNDVVGDICGVVAGSASATVAVQLIQKFSFSWPALISLILSALVAGLTVGGKAIGKTVAVHSCVKIVHFAGRTIYALRSFFCREPRKTNNNR